MIAGMTLEIVPIAYHINLSIIAGILLGPALAFISVFIVDLIISMFGHGGITVVGLNTIVIGAEAVLGYYLFQLLRTVMAGQGHRMVFGARGRFEPLSEHFDNAGDSLRFAYKPGRGAPYGGDGSRYWTAATAAHMEAHGSLDFGRFVKTIFLLAPLGWALEAAVTGLVVSYLYRVRPDSWPRRRRKEIAWTFRQ